MTSSRIDFGELSNDINFVSKVTNISDAIDKIEKSIRQALKLKKYDQLSVQEKVKYDLFLSYSINSLYWMFVKLQGEDPNTHDIKHELSRVRQAMTRDKQIYERNTIRPVLDKGAAGRFIRHGLHIRRPADDDDGNEYNDNHDVIEESRPQNKRIRFDD